jgi:hypothetical protein
MQAVRFCCEIINQRSDEQTIREAIKKFARVFIDRLESTIIVVAMHINENDIRYEDEGPAMLKKPFTAEDLGTAVAEAMKKAERRNNFLRDRKLSDWPAYRASGQRTVRKFEESFISISVEGANAANLVAVISGDPEKGSVLQVTSTISTGVSPADLGERILLVYNACRDRRV